MRSIFNKINYLVKSGFFHIFSSSVINKIIVFVSNIIIIRIVSKSDFGVYSYALNIVSLVLLFTGLGLVSGTFQLCSECGDDIKRKKHIFEYGCSCGSRFNLVLAGIILGIACFVPLPIYGAHNILKTMFFFPVVYIIFEFQQIYLRSDLRNKEYAYSTTFNTAFVMIFSVLGAIVLGIEGLVLGRYIAYIFTIVFIVKMYKVKPSFKNNEISENDKKTLWAFSITSMCNNGISELLYLLDVFILGLVVLDEQIIASYKVATVIPTACTFIPLAVITYVYPFFAKNREDYEWSLEKYSLLLKCIGALNFIVSLFMFVFAELIIIIVYGENYLDATICFRILAINYFISGTFRIISGNLLVTQRKLKFNLYINILCGLINVIGNVILIPKYGSVGAALSTLIVVIVSSIISTSYYVYVLKSKNGGN